jgi:hypothetical protein
MAQLHAVNSAHKLAVVDERAAYTGAEIHAEDEIMACRAATQRLASRLQCRVVIKKHRNVAFVLQPVGKADTLQGRKKRGFQDPATRPIEDTRHANDSAIDPAACGFSDASNEFAEDRDRIAIAKSICSLRHPMKDSTRIVYCGGTKVGASDVDRDYLEIVAHTSLQYLRRYRLSRADDVVLVYLAKRTAQAPLAVEEN